MKKTENKKENNEYENEKVHNSSLKKWTHFLGMYAGEHAAGTEFVIGPLFLTTGVSAFDLLAGLLVGNLLAVLSWRFLTAEIAVKYRYTLYFHLEKIMILYDKCSINIIEIFCGWLFSLSRFFGRGNPSYYRYT